MVGELEHVVVSGAGVKLHLFPLPESEYKGVAIAVKLLVDVPVLGAKCAKHVTACCLDDHDGLQLVPHFVEKGEWTVSVSPRGVQ